MQTAYLLIGGNIGDSKAYLAEAKNLIEKKCGQVINASSIYSTAAWGVTNQADFLNQVLVLTTKMKPLELMQAILEIETSMGRIRAIKMGPRIIDIDILLIDNEIVNTDLLTLPHPALTQRNFALIPLKEIAPELIHPVEKKTISQLLQSSTDTLDVQKLS
jgi:2-amino-4-hydroxy-6-hydroxymethyldihydropteridine diphosphokinase